MRLTTKGRFAVTAMVDLAIHGGHGPVTLASISERQKISLSYLEQLFGKLRKHDVVASVRGPGGGYCLSRPANKISISDIIVAVDESLDASQCHGMANCHDDKQCITHDLWMGLNKTLLSYLESVSLHQLVSNELPRHTANSPITMVNHTHKPLLTAA
ncbi:MAG: Fe-S cluster assembly transcriptional regulator IscR [Gallionellaceae bacterium]|jgi:Rrf2 family iron-sulfur cluster assembly transcriptional regulator